MKAKQAQKVVFSRSNMETAKSKTMEIRRGQRC